MIFQLTTSWEADDAAVLIETLWNVFQLTTSWEADIEKSAQSDSEVDFNSRPRERPTKERKVRPMGKIFQLTTSWEADWIRLPDKLTRLIFQLTTSWEADYNALMSDRVTDISTHDLVRGRLQLYREWPHIFVFQLTTSWEADSYIRAFYHCLAYFNSRPRERPTLPLGLWTSVQ